MPALGDAMQLGLEYRHPEWAGPSEPNNSALRNVRWLSFYQWNEGTREYYEHGISEARSLHFPNDLTESSRQRICRLFGAYGCK